MFDYKVNQFKILKMFSYTSVIPYRDTKFDLDANWVDQFPNIKEKFDKFYNDLCDEAEKQWKNFADQNSGWFAFHDNKTVYQIKNKFSGQIFYIGRYDFTRSIGTSCYLYDGYIYDFTKGKKSEYLSDVISTERGLFQKFEV